MTALALALHQLRYDQKVFWRNPASVFFTVAFPAIFLVLVGVIVGDQTIDGDRGIDARTYFVAAVITLAVVSATTVNLAMNLTIARENGVLKRLRGTPVPTWVFIAGRVGNAIVTSLLMLAVIAGLGAILFGVEVPWARVPELLVALFLGAATFCTLGVALSAAIPSREAASAITNAIVFPLYFLSGIFIPDTEIPSGVLEVGDLFPVSHLFDLLLAAFDPDTAGATLELGDLAVIALWGVGGVLIAVRTFRWTPRRD